jgi:hypothetical protein
VVQSAPSRQFREPEPPTTGDRHPTWSAVTRRLFSYTRHRGAAPNRCPTFSTFRLPVSPGLNRLVSVALMRASRRKAVSLNDAAESGDFPHSPGTSHPDMRDGPSISSESVPQMTVACQLFGSPHRTRTCTEQFLKLLPLPIGIRSHWCLLVDSNH